MGSAVARKAGRAGPSIWGNPPGKPSGGTWPAGKMARIADAFLIVGALGRPFNRDALRQVIQWLGERAGVKKAHPHRFRHTFAISYLRAGGDVFTLQLMLGHSSLDMVQHYARLAELDVEAAHRKASPADNWHL